MQLQEECTASINFASYLWFPRWQLVILTVYMFDTHVFTCCRGGLFEVNRGPELPIEEKYVLIVN